MMIYIKQETAEELGSKQDEVKYLQVRLNKFILCTKYNKLILK